MWSCFLFTLLIAILAMLTTTNTSALNTINNLRSLNLDNKSYERLSSGLRINRAADDSAGLAISSKMTAQIRGLNQANRNAMDGISLLQTADGALTEVHNILQRMRELFVQASNEVLAEKDRAAINYEIIQLKDEVSNIAQKTTFNNKLLFANDFVDGLTYKNYKTTSFDFFGISISNLENANARSLAITTPTIAEPLSKVDVIDDGTGGYYTAMLPVLDFITDNRKFYINGKSFLFNVTGGATGTADYILNVSDCVYGAGKFTDCNDNSIKADTIIDALEKVFLSNSDKFGDFFVAMAADDESFMFMLMDNNDIDINWGIEFEFDIDFSSFNNGDKLTVGDMTYIFKTNGISTMSLESEILLKNITSIADLANELNKQAPTDIEFFTENSDGKLHALYTGIENVNSLLNGIKFIQAPPSPPIDPNPNPKPDPNPDIITTKNASSSLFLQIGANYGNFLEIKIPTISAKTLNISSVSAETVEEAQNSITSVSNAIETISSARSFLGAVQNRLEHTVKNLTESSINLSASKSRIMNADMAKEIIKHIGLSIINNASIYILSNSTKNAKSVLEYIK